MPDVEKPHSQAKIVKSDQEWRRQLTPQQYEITRQHGTEPAFTGQYCDTKTDGIYECLCCGESLYASTTKYDSGTGWPSFWDGINENAITSINRFSLSLTNFVLKKKLLFGFISSYDF